MSLPPESRHLERFASETWKLAAVADGYLSQREGKFLIAAAALAPARGANVEIGSFKGRSTICIARTCAAYGHDALVAIDPHTAPAITDPDLKGAKTTFDTFEENLRRAGVANAVKPIRAFSNEVAKNWTEPIRFLWIDVDHTYAGAKADVDGFRRFLVPGAILAMHDVLGTHYGSLRTFVEEVLDSSEFGAAGFCGSIGWAQYRPGEGDALRYRLKRKLLAIPARQIIPVAQSPAGLVGMNKLRYKIWRPLAPHGELNIARFAARLGE